MVKMESLRAVIDASEDKAPALSREFEDGTEG